MSRKLVERVSRVVDRRAGRRGFLRKSAMAATAVAVAPVAYAIRPTTAEAAVILCKGWECRPSALCCDPYSEFCCKLTGENLCPPRTIVAGWWKVDGSGFCDLNGPQPRYYLDCNFTCDARSGCHCRSNGFCDRGCTPARCQCSGGCDTRKSECTRFRYGQCNQDVCVGQLACRIVTCVPPWTWDPACATSPVLYDPGTRWHDRPCLHEGFNDVPPRAYYAEAVKWMADEGITTGMKADLFGPDELVNRAQFATFLWRYEGRPQVEPGNKFNDVPEDAFYAQAVAWMVEQGITTGRTRDRFDPSSDVSRAQSIVFLHRLAGEPQGEARIEFDDVGSDAWYRNALAWALEHNIAWWAEQSTFDAEEPATRAEIAALLHGYHLRPRAGLTEVAP